MKKLFTEEEYKKAKSHDLLWLQCYVCDKKFTKEKYLVKRDTLSEYDKGRFCSHKCSGEYQCQYGKSKSIINCIQCGIEFEKRNKDIARTKNNFCGRSCAATYHNTHKTTGNRRSKLEVWIEQQLTNDYPNLTIKYNDRTQIGSELDIYVENSKLAFELNGIFHYEAIYGEDKLEKIQNNDNRKFAACLEKGIELCIIDSSSSVHFKPERDIKYLNIIKSIIEQNLPK